MEGLNPSAGVGVVLVVFAPFYHLVAGCLGCVIAVCLSVVLRGGGVEAVLVANELFSLLVVLGLGWSV